MALNSREYHDSELAFNSVLCFKSPKVFDKAAHRTFLVGISTKRVFNETVFPFLVDPRFQKCQRIKVPP